jgi:putative flippase GtrA
MRVKFHKLSSLFRFKILRYLVIGAIAASVDLIIFSVAIYFFNVSWFLSSVFSTIVSTLAGYYLSICFVFQSEVRYKKYQEMLGVIAISFFAFILHQSLLYFFIEILNVNMILAKVIVIASVFFFNYFSRSRLIFRE